MRRNYFSMPMFPTTRQHYRRKKSITATTEEFSAIPAKK
jgi:hypothetical protein